MCAPHPDEIYKQTAHWHGQMLPPPVATRDTTSALVENNKILVVRKAMVSTAIQAVFTKIGRKSMNNRP